jgi:sulfopyruvate decarboxylase alpha subunit
VDANTFLQALKDRGVTFAAGVPDSTFLAAFRAIEKEPSLHYVPAVREDVALGVASAAYFVGGLGAVMMQNSGLGNIVNPLTSFSLMYKIPVLLVIGWRGHGGPPNDAPEHWIMGTKTPALLDLLEIPYEVPGPRDVGEALDRLLKVIIDRSTPGALLICPGVIS